MNLNAPEMLHQAVEFFESGPTAALGGNYGSPGTGSSLQLMVDTLAIAADIHLVHVPYKGLGPAEADLLPDHIDVMFDNKGSAMPYIKAGKYKALGVASKSRIAELPDVPTIADSFPDFIFAEWFAFVAPPKTSPEIATKLSQAVAEIVKLPDVAQRFHDVSITPVGSSPAETAALVKQQSERWNKIVAQLGVKIE